MALGQRSCLGTGARHMALGHLQGHGGHGRHWGRIHGFGAIYKGTGANYMALGPLTMALGQRSCLGTGARHMALGHLQGHGGHRRHWGRIHGFGAIYKGTGANYMALGPLTMALGQRSCLGTGARHMALGHLQGHGGHRRHWGRIHGFGAIYKGTGANLQGHGGHRRHWGRIHGFGAIYKGTGANYMALGPLTLALGQRSCLGTGATGALELSRHWL